MTDYTAAIAESHHIHMHSGFAWHHSPELGVCTWETRACGQTLTCDRPSAAQALCITHLADAWINGWITFLPSMNDLYDALWAAVQAAEKEAGT